MKLTLAEDPQCSVGALHPQTMRDLKARQNNKIAFDSAS